MLDFQSLIFRSAARWSELTSVVVLGIGLLYTLQGFRFAHFLITATCAAGGLVLGGILAGLADLPLITAFIPAAFLGLLGLARFRTGLALASAFAGAATLQYLAIKIGLSPHMSIVAAGAGLIAGYCLIWVCPRTLPILVTIVQGAGLLIVGFVGITNAAVPSLGATFLEWSAGIPLLVPGFMVMLCVLGYSVQANAMQGDLETGGSRGLRDLETP